MSPSPIEESLRRCDAAQDELNLFTFIDREGARRRMAGYPSGPLAGVAVAVKDLIDQAGLPTTCGSSFYRRVAQRSAPAVVRLEDAGAVVVGRTGLHEFAFGFTSENHWFGPVRNPWDPATSPGGSSGGSAAAVAAGCVPLAVGTDTGGSVRVPAAMCGVFGLKVTHGRIPLAGVFPLVQSLDTVGPLARNVSDLTAAYLAMAGPDPADPWSSPQPAQAPQQRETLDGLRIGVPHPWADRPIEREIRRGFETTLAAATEDGAAIIDLEATDLVPDDTMQKAGAAEIAAVHEDWFTQDPDRYGPSVRERLYDTLQIPLSTVGRVPAWQAAKRASARNAFDMVDLLATPMTAVRRKIIGEGTVDVDGGREPYRPALWAFSWLVNHLTCPAVALPVPAESGPPSSLQLIAPRWSEHLLLEVAARLETVGAVTCPPPPIFFGD